MNGLIRFAGGLALFALAGHLVAQKYCLSGVVQSVYTCSNCGIAKDQPVAVTVDVQPSTISCSPNLYGLSCVAYAAATVDLGSQHWASTPGVVATEAMVSIGSATVLSASTTSFNVTGATIPSTAGAAQLPFALGLGVAGYPGNLLQSGTLPANLPSPADVIGSRSILTFNGGTSNGGGFFSYTGQSCAVGGGALSLAPVITTGGVVPNGSTATTVQSGSWISIYGTNLATGTALWNADFPQSLLGTSVNVNSKPAYLWYVSPTQINLQAPDDLTTGLVNVVVTTPAGTFTSFVTLGSVGPSLSLLDGKHVAAIILRADGTYDIAGPTGTSLGYPTVAAKAGDTLELFGVGFGPTNPAVPAGKPFSGSAPTTNSVQFTINGNTVLPSYSGLTSAGLYQFNVTLPAGLGTGDVSLQAAVAGAISQPGVVLTLQ